MVETFEARRRIIVGALNAVRGFRCVTPGGAFYAFPNIEGTGRTSRELQEELLSEVGVAIISGTSFGRYGEGFVRFSYAASSEAIEEACGRICRHLER
jgi:aspartate/methionine/tyrosine aminotransferase